MSTAMTVLAEASCSDDITWPGVVALAVIAFVVLGSIWLMSR